VPPAKPRWWGCRRGARLMRSHDRGSGPSSARCASAQALELDLRARRDALDQMTSVSKDLRAGADHISRWSGPRSSRAGLGRRHAQMAAESARRASGRAATRGRVRLYPGSQAARPCACRASRLHADLFVLHTGTQRLVRNLHARRDVGQVDGGARSSRRLAGRVAARRRIVPTVNAGLPELISTEERTSGNPTCAADASSPTSS